ncbi:MAG: sugar transferase [Arachnia sp.]
MDIGLSAVALVVSVPFQAITAMLVLVAHGRPVLFSQERPGLNGEVFELLKFRSMQHEDATHKTDADRLTHVGRFIRATSLDELPSLWNVLKGDMSLVGPRPLRTHYMPLYNARQARRHEVRPGITGLAQVRGRNLLSWEDRFEMDVEYVENLSFKLDVSIIGQTVSAVRRRTGVSAVGEATMTPFKGSENCDA